MENIAQNAGEVNGHHVADLPFGDVVQQQLAATKPGDPFRRLWKAGYGERLIPIIPPDAPISDRSSIARRLAAGKDDRGKTPGICGSNGLWHSFNWSKHETTEDDIHRWQRMGAGVGIRTGDLGNGLSLVVIDADTTDPLTAGIVRSVLDARFGELPLRIGRAPKGAYVALVHGSFRYARIEFGERDEKGRLLERVEILSDGRQFVAHGIHPKTGKPYRWERGLPALDKLPVLDGDEILAALEELRPLLPQASEVEREGGASPSGPPCDQASLTFDPAHVRRAVEAMPNPLDYSRDQYIAIGYAIKAAMGPENEAEGLALFQDWAERWEGGGDDINLSDMAEADWRRLHPPFRRGANWLFREAERLSGGAFTVSSVWFEPVDAREPLFPEVGHEDDDALALRRKPITATPYTFVDPSTLPRRNWIYSDHLIRKFVSVTAAPSKMGKSSLLICEALAMASGKPLLGVQPHGQFAVWYWNGEDPFDELQKKVEATRQHYGLTPEDIGNRFFLDSGRQTQIVLAQASRDGTKIAQPIAAEVVMTLRTLRIDVMMVDPFVSIHRVSENDNGAIDAVAKTFNMIADESNVAIDLVHHVRKTNDAEVTLEDARGAGSLIAASRSARALTRMPKEQANRLGIGEARKSIFRTSDATSNLAPARSENNQSWLRLTPVGLANGGGSGAERVVTGDSVGVVTTYELPDLAREVEGNDENRVLEAVAVGQWRKDVQSRDAWVGVPVGQALRLDLDVPTEKVRVKSIIAGLLKAGKLEEYNAPGPNRSTRVYVRVTSNVASSSVFE